MKVLVSGDRGYIGAVLVPGGGHEVDGLDNGLYEGCDLGPARPEPAPGRLATCATSHPGRARRL